MLKKKMLIATVALAATGFSGVASAHGDPILGAVLGAGVGAVIGSNLNGRDGAIVGGAIGAAAGAAATRGGHGYVSGSVSVGGPAYYAPAPVYYTPPAPVVYAPAPPVVVYRPRPVYVVHPAPVAYYPEYKVRYDRHRGHRHGDWDD
jgi:hypothetical protein